LKRLAAPLTVFILGIAKTPHCLNIDLGVQSPFVG